MHRLWSFSVLYAISIVLIGGLGSCYNPTFVPEICGDGNRIEGEECDDSNQSEDDSCKNDCTRSLKQIVAGWGHTCALFANGKARCWGGSPEGQLGYGDTNTIGDNEKPNAKGDVNVGGTVIQLAASNDHTCALLDSGKVRCWGYGFYGELGYGNKESVGDNETPASKGDVEVGEPVVQLTAGYHHTCALLVSGNVRCWGEGVGGQLGYGTTESLGDDEFPDSKDEVNVGGTVVQVAAGENHTCVLLDSGKVRCWGYGTSGKLGYGDTESVGDNETPASKGDIEVGEPVIQIATGTEHTCAVLNSWNVRCWGSNKDGQLGYGNTGDDACFINIQDYNTFDCSANPICCVGDDETPASKGNVEIGEPVVQLSAGDRHTCALLESGNIRCWGDNSSGQIGYGNTEETIGDDETPATKGNVNIGEKAIQLATGNLHTCVLLDSGNVRCWGYNEYGQLGYGHINSIGDDEVPNSVGFVPIF